MSHELTLREKIYQLAQDPTLRPHLLPLVVQPAPSPVTYRVRHAFNNAVGIVKAGGFGATEVCWLSSVGYPGDTVTPKITFVDFTGNQSRSGFTEAGTYWIEGTCVCNVIVHDQWGRKLTGTFTNPVWGHEFQDDGKYPTIFQWKPGS